MNIRIKYLYTSPCQKEQRKIIGFQNKFWTESYYVDEIYYCLLFVVNKDMFQLKHVQVT